MLQCELTQAGLALFPVCKRCFGGLLERPGDSFVPVVESSAVDYVFPENGIREPQMETGFLYSDIPGFTPGRRADWEKGVQYVFARPLAETCARFRRRFVSPPAQVELTVILE